MSKAWAASKNPLWIAYIQSPIVINFNQDFMASTHGDYFQGQVDRELIYWPNHSEETQLFNQLREEVKLYMSQLFLSSLVGMFNFIWTLQ